MAIDLKAVGAAAITMFDAIYAGAKSKPLEDRLEKLCYSLPAPGMFEAGDEGYYKQSLGAKEAAALAQLLAATLAVVPHLEGDAIETFGRVAAQEGLLLISEGTKK